MVSALSVAREVHLATEWAAWLSFAKTPQQLNAIPVTCYMTSSYVIDFQCALNFGEAQTVRALQKNYQCIDRWAIAPVFRYERHSVTLALPFDTCARLV